MPAKIKSIFYLTFPLILSLIIMGGLVLYMGHPKERWFYFSLITFIFIFIIGMEIYIFRTRVVPQFNESERIQKLLASQDQSGKLLIRRDLELTRANEKLRELDERKSEFVSVVAHQLRTPLSGIKWTLNMLINGELGETTSEQKTYLMKTYESNERMIALVDDMLGADRVESGKFHYVFTEVQLLDLFDNVLYEILPQANRKNIKIQFTKRDPGTKKVIADPEKIRAVIQNLLENAIKYTNFGGQIGIGIEGEGENIKVAISDNGIGIPKEQQRNIFNRFFRATNALKVETDGSGLGLFIVKSIIEKHGGKIWFESTENVGSTFYFTLKAVR